ncbi:MAG: glycosyltransferase family 4 protein [Gemmatimonadaceae bacterium]
MRLLVLTSEYPNPNSAYDTPVVHYYVKEWIARGHDVRVYHSRSVFPAPFYPLARMLKSFVKRMFRTDFIPFHRLKGVVRYRHDGVDVVSLPVFKLFPHMRFFDRTLRRLARVIHEENTAHGFVPDVIICHFVNPQLPLIPELKRFYPEAKASLVVHEDPKIIAGLFGRDAVGLLRAVDRMGFRFREMQDRFVRDHGNRADLFICPSGVPEQFVRETIPDAKFRGAKTSFCFAGMLIPLKNVDVLLHALHQAFPAKDFTLRIIGQGLLEPALVELVRKLGIADCVTFEGHRSRVEVQARLEESDVFAMVSKPEAFGLVYLEAMAKGCLTIGTRGQGIDGVIVDGDNGFLCEAGDVAGLRDTIRRIAAMSYEQKTAVSRRALQTAATLTDRKVADSYLEKIGVR